MSLSSPCDVDLAVQGMSLSSPCDVDLAVQGTSLMLACSGAASRFLRSNPSPAPNIHATFIAMYGGAEPEQERPPECCWRSLASLRRPHDACPPHAHPLCACCRWEEIDHPDAVQTPANVYGSLAHEGFAVKYVRVPVTDGTAPSVRKGLLRMQHAAACTSWHTCSHHSHKSCTVLIWTQAAEVHSQLCASAPCTV